ncbi:ABC transporter permease subunit [Xylophilus rhododendri]|uniref:ABC transporter permease subunit n=1 Tax=Xylophilus rhododendri TaxID=2697032 RepID=A0A857J7L7_9BURK|nr:ABC transporter permease [Xylophilus rhododendri]QHI99846.1 ABC transporter permease subunit [Xylophilus rhododendri]
MAAHPPHPGAVRLAAARLHAPRWRPRAATWLPLAAGLLALLAWEALVRLLRVPPFVLPAPSAIAAAFMADSGGLLLSLANTAAVTLGAFALALVTGLGAGVLIAQNRTVEMTLWPYAIVMQVTPVVAIAPIVMIWVGMDRVWLALLILAWLVAFFPILANTVAGLKSVDRGLTELFQLYGTSRWKRFRHLQLPAALPHVLTGARISSGLAVIGAVVAEFVAGSGTARGLGWAIVESGSMLNVPRMFAALVLLSLFGLAVWALTTLVQRRLLAHWHESETAHEH